jgi:hypothetical protein
MSGVLSAILRTWRAERLQYLPVHGYRPAWAVRMVSALPRKLGCQVGYG